MGKEEKIGKIEAVVSQRVCNRNEGNEVGKMEEWK